MEWKIWQRTEGEEPSVYTQFSSLSVSCVKDWITALPAQSLPTATPAASTASSQAPTATSRASAANLQASLPESRPSTRGHLRPNKNPKTPTPRKSPAEDKEFDDATDEEDHADVGREDESLFQDDSDHRIEDLREEPTDTFTEGPGSIDEPPDFEDPKQVEAWASQYDGCSPADLMVRYGLGLFITMIVTFTNLHLDYTQSGIARVTENELYVYFAIMLIMSVLKAPNAKLYWKAQRRGILPEGPAFQFPDLTFYLPYQRFTQIQNLGLHKRHRRLFYTMSIYTGILFLQCYIVEYISSTSAARSQHYIPITSHRATSGQTGVQAGISLGSVVVPVCEMASYE